jgi:protein involved in polysaccharide export with SLBB domain
MKTNSVEISKRVGYLSRAVILITILALCGCVIPKHRAVINETPPQMAQCVTKHFPFGLYRLAEGDILEFLYLTIPTVTKKPYRITVRDQVDVEFAFHPEMNRTVRVRPDGKISIPRKDDVEIAGLTADEVKRKLTRIYSDLLKEPVITVSLREFNARLAELQRAIATAPYGQARLITIRPDGQLSLPLITDQPAAGLTVAQLTKEVNKRYQKLIGDITVSVMLREVVGNKVFVDGEVRNRGVFTLKGPTTVQQAIAMAGGTLETAEPRSVLLVSKGPDGRFITRTTDLAALGSNEDYYLGRYDLVYVPRSRIARADAWVDQNIRKLLLFTGWNLGIQADLGRVTTR